MSATSKARKGDLVAWRDDLRISCVDRPSYTTTRWFVGVVASATRDGAVKTATRGRYLPDGVPDRKVATAERYVLAACRLSGSAQSVAMMTDKGYETLDAVRAAVRPYLRAGAL